MPPDASSRSRMYLPKIWGNTRLLHRSVVVGGALGCACTTLPGSEETHLIAAHWASSECTGAAGSTGFSLEALGDFPISPENYEQLKVAEDLLVPSTTRGASLTASDGFLNFSGLGLPASGKDLDVSLWSSDGPCGVPVATDCGYPDAGGGYAIGVTSDARTLLIAGGGAPLNGAMEPDPSLARRAAMLDLGTGRISCIPPERALQSGRAGATITAVGNKLLVAGGVEPVQNTPQLTAEIFDPGTGEFDPDPIPLLRDGRNGRAHHAAVTLASGETLLVGGVDATGIPLSTLEAIAPETPHHRNENDENEREAALDTPRVDPVAIRLSDDRIFIAGGTNRLEAPRQLQDMVWLDKSARTIERQVNVLACPDDQSSTCPGPDGDRVPCPTMTVGSAFASMPDGAVLAVGGCATRLDKGPLDCDQHCGEDGLGCPTNEIFWIDRDGNVSCCGEDRQGCSGPGINLNFRAFVDPVLVPAEGGRPWLIEGAPSARTFRRFDPWTGQFPSSSVATNAEPTSEIVPSAADAGLFLWLEQCTNNSAGSCITSLHGFRHGVRGPYTQAVEPLLLSNTVGVSLDRGPFVTTDTCTAAPGPCRDPMNGKVRLTPDSELVVTDTTYENVHVEIQVSEGPPPVVHLGPLALGSASKSAQCKWPTRAPRTPFVADVVRNGETVTLTIGHAVRECAGPSGRVSIAIGAEAEPVTVGPVAVTRIATP